MAHKGKYEAETNSKIKDPELKRDGATRYLGHFSNPKFLNRGHNECPKMPEENDEAHAKRCAAERRAKAAEAVRKSFLGSLGKKTFGL